ncbi:hypothetical protein V4890_18500 [Ralstonia solanacearum species complex bacterium KE056]|uniref:hypothetical protein n=1 Tax=Ralstonia solanacearum species complex bacterium KE056 TaxID=3119585 RepID=UPI002FC2F97C
MIYSVKLCAISKVNFIDFVGCLNAIPQHTEIICVMSSRISGFWGRNYPDFPSQSDDRDDKPPTVSKVQVREAYAHSVLFHGTTLPSRRAIQSHGFRLENKSRGSIGAYAEIKSNSDAAMASSTHHYLTENKEIAKRFAKLVGRHRGEQPALVRTIGVMNHFSVEQDPDANAHCLRTNEDIPSRYVLGSKGSPAGENARIFKKELEADGHDISSDEAGDLLRSVQSDSDSDF